VLGGTSLILFSVSVLTGCAASNDAVPDEDQVDVPVFTQRANRGHVIIAPTLRQSIHGPGSAISAIIQGVEALVPNERPLRILLVTADGDEAIFHPAGSLDGTVVTRLSASERVGDFLPATDVLVIGDFVSAPDRLDALTKRWRPLLEPFVNAGGIVVVIGDPVGFTPSPSYALVSDLLPLLPRIDSFAANALHRRYGTVRPRSVIDEGLQLDEIPAPPVVSFQVLDPDATWLVDAGTTPRPVRSMLDRSSTRSFHRTTPQRISGALGFEPDGYRSIQCTVRDLGPPETVSQSWPCTDLHASGDVVVDYVLPEKPPGFFDYTVRVEIIDNDGKTASVERSFTVTWI